MRPGISAPSPAPHHQLGRAAGNGGDGVFVVKLPGTPPMPYTLSYAIQNPSLFANSISPFTTPVQAASGAPARKGILPPHLRVVCEIFQKFSPLFHGKDLILLHKGDILKHVVNLHVFEERAGYLQKAICQTILSLAIRNKRSAGVSGTSSASLRFPCGQGVFCSSCCLFVDDSKSPIII